MLFCGTSIQHGLRQICCCERKTLRIVCLYQHAVVVQACYIQGDAYLPFFIWPEPGQ